MSRMVGGVDNISLDVEEENASGIKYMDGHYSVERGTQNEALRPSIEVLSDDGFTKSYDNDDSRKITQQEKKLYKPLRNVVETIISRRGVILALLSAFLFSVQGLVMKMVPTKFSGFQFVAFTMSVLLVGSLLGILLTRAPRPKQPTNYLWLFLSGLTISMSFTTFALAVRYLDVSDAVAVTYSSLIFVCIFSWLILKEPLRIFDFVFSFMALAGVVFISRPQPLFGQSQQDSNSNKTSYLIGIAFGLGSALALSLRSIVYKKVNQMEIGKFLPMFAVGCVGLLSNVVICTALNQWVVPQTRELLYAAGSGVSFTFAHMCLVMSLKLEKATIVSILLTFEISFSFLLQFVFLGVSPAWTSYVGSLLLIFASVGCQTALVTKHQVGYHSAVSGHWELLSFPGLRLSGGPQHHLSVRDTSVLNNH